MPKQKRKSPVRHRVRSHPRKVVMFIPNGPARQVTVQVKEHYRGKGRKNQLKRIIHKRKITDTAEEHERKISFVEDFIKDTYSAMGRSYAKILKDNIPRNAMTAEEFIDFLQTPYIRTVDNKMYRDHTDKSITKKEVLEFIREMKPVAKKHFTKNKEV